MTSKEENVIMLAIAVIALMLYVLSEIVVYFVDQNYRQFEVIKIQGMLIDAYEREAAIPMTKKAG